MLILQRWLLLGIVPIALGALIAWWGSPRGSVSFSAGPNAQSEKPTQKEAPVAATPVRLVGTASCSSRGCHGALHSPLSSVDPGKCLQNEYVRWIDDPHANAYRVLFDDRARRIMELLDVGTASKSRAYEDVRCLACHTNPGLTGIPEGHRPLQDEKQFGVGCESCHGGAGKWLVPHTNSSWRKLSAKEKWAKYEMVPVTDPGHLAQACVGCHIGSPPNPTRGIPLQDVNHDLIAAGHPRLNFEFGSFLANVPPHWRPRKKPEGNYWAVGQFVSVQAALELLVERAKSGPWPEFAEYNCFSCHHSLAQPSWRQKPASARNETRRPGSLAWGSWYFPLLRDSRAELGNLAKMMEQPAPDRKEVQKQAQFALGRLFGSHRPAARDKNEAIFNWLKKVSLSAEPNWDSAEQIYLGLSALNLAQPDPATSKLLLELTPIRQFPQGLDSPASWPTNGQPAFHPDDFFDKLRSAYKPMR